MPSSSGISVVRAITPEQKKRLDSYTGLNHPVEFKNKYRPGKVRLGRVIDEVGFISFDYKYVIQKIELEHNIIWDGSRYAYRSGYYTFDGRMEKVVWGQYHSCLSEREYEQLLALARAKGWPVL
jgi:hypothetical protein